MTISPLGPGSVSWLGTHYRTVLSPDITGGAMSIVDSVSPPNSGPPMHVHKDADETFVMLTGECEFWLEGDRFYRGAGETAFIPRGKQHTFRIVGDQPSRHLLILTPGGFEGFFHEMAEGDFKIPDQMAEIAAIAARYHLEFTGPPLAAAE